MLTCMCGYAWVQFKASSSCAALTACCTLELSGGCSGGSPVSMLGSCLQGGSDDSVGARMTDVKEESPQQGKMGDEARTAGEFWNHFFHVRAPAILKAVA